MVRVGSIPGCLCCANSRNVGQPVVQRSKVRSTFGCETAILHVADLSSISTLSPAERTGAGDRFEQVVQLGYHSGD